MIDTRWRRYRSRLRVKRVARLGRPPFCHFHVLRELIHSPVAHPNAYLIGEP